MLPSSPRLTSAAVVVKSPRLVPTGLSQAPQSAVLPNALIAMSSSSADDEAAVADEATEGEADRREGGRLEVDRGEGGRGSSSDQTSCWGSNGIDLFEVLAINPLPFAAYPFHFHLPFTTTHLPLTTCRLPLPYITSLLPLTTHHLLLTTYHILEVSAIDPEQLTLTSQANGQVCVCMCMCVCARALVKCMCVHVCACGICMCA